MSGAPPYYGQGIGGNGPGSSSSFRGNSMLIQSSSVPAFNTHGRSSSVADGLAVVAPKESVKRKRGRPRKYGPDGTVASRSSTNLVSTQEAAAASAPPTQKRGRGRPPGSGRKQQLALLGEWVASSAGIGFAPHVIIATQGEDIASTILSFSRQSHRAVFVMSATGSVSTATLQRPETPGRYVTYQGLFDILCLSGSYFSDGGESQAQTGSLSICLAYSDSKLIGGAVRGPIVAATPVQIIVGTFNYGGTKAKEKGKNKQETAGDSSRSLFSTLSHQNLGHSMEGWPNLKHMEIRSDNIGINPTRR